MLIAIFGALLGWAAAFAVFLQAHSARVQTNVLRAQLNQSREQFEAEARARGEQRRAHLTVDGGSIGPTGGTITFANAGPAPASMSPCTLATRRAHERSLHRSPLDLWVSKNAGLRPSSLIPTWMLTRVGSGCRFLTTPVLVRQLFRKHVLESYGTRLSSEAWILCLCRRIDVEPGSGCESYP